MLKRPRVALLVETSRAYGRGLLRGIAAYCQMHGPWSIYHHERALGEAAPAWIKQCDIDGFIARLENPGLIRLIQQMRLPTVDLRGVHEHEGIPQIIPDQQAVARLAADHLLERGFKHFACCRFAGINYARWRSEHFLQYLRDVGHECSLYESPQPSPSPITANIEAGGLLREPALAEWIESLPKPLGLWATNDVLAQQVINSCGDFGIAVPDEVAVIGVDNDDIICELCYPPLSSVELDIRKMGYEAAALLDRMIHGEKPPREITHIVPLGVVARQSTDATAIADPDVTAAMHFIREYACNGINVAKVVERVGVSRSTLKRKFSKLLGRSPKDEILRVRIERVERLLSETDYPLETIAQLTGFGYVANMCSLFKKKTGRTPGEYRKTV